MNDIIYKEVSDPAQRAAVCERVLRALPEWFGIEESLLEYVESCKGMDTFAAAQDGRAVGFVSLAVQTPFAHELHVMGIEPALHRQGIGRVLVRLAAQRAKERGAAYLTVKTVADLSPDPGYARTRAFYRAMGFIPIEVFPTLWDEQNPCLLSILPLSARD